MIFEDYERNFEPRIEEPKKKHPEGVVLDDGQVYIDGNPWDLKTVLVGIEINQEAIARGEKVEYHQAFLDKLLQAKDILLTLPDPSDQALVEIAQPIDSAKDEVLVPLSVILIDKGKALIDQKIIVNFDLLFREIDRLTSKLKEDPKNLKDRVLLDAYLKAKKLMIASIR